MTIGEFIRENREKKGISIRELSRLSGVSHPYISQIETGKNDKPSPDLLKKISKHIEVPYSKLMIEAGYLTGDEWNQELAILIPNIKGKESQLLELIEENQKGTKDLNDLLNGVRAVYYNGHLLTKEECHRIIEMLNIMYPEYKEHKRNDL